MKINKICLDSLQLPNDPIERQRILHRLELRNCFIIKVRNTSFKHSGLQYGSSQQFSNIIFIEGISITGKLKKIFFLQNMVALAERNIKLNKTYFFKKLRVWHDPKLDEVPIFVFAKTSQIFQIMRASQLCRLKHDIVVPHNIPDELVRGKFNVAGSIKSIEQTSTCISSTENQKCKKFSITLTDVQTNTEITIQVIDSMIICSKLKIGQEIIFYNTKFQRAVDNTYEFIFTNTGSLALLCRP